MINQILDFWFGELKDGFTITNRGKLWYMGGEEVDSEIKEKFGEVIEKACNKELESWKETAKGRLALIILLDQFTRNVYRKSKEAFAYDSYALELCNEGIELGHDKELCFIHRFFLYQPLEHSEKLEDQELCIELFEKVKEEVPEEKKKRVDSFIGYAINHRDIIKKFGRFPHRNEVLGRKNTSEEVKYLQKAERFGQ